MLNNVASADRLVVHAQNLRNSAGISILRGVSSAKHLNSPNIDLHHESWKGLKRSGVHVPE